MQQNLRIGIISYTNLYPIFHALREQCDCSAYEFAQSYPSHLNHLLRQGHLDVSPSSSIEYLRGEGAYQYIPGHSISAEGAVRSIILFSRVPMCSLSGRDVYMTHHSETSAALLQIIMRKLRFCCNFVTSEAPFAEAITEHSAYLAIGDEALKYFHSAQEVDKNQGPLPYRLCTIHHQAFYLYDLSELWHNMTGLPFVFALWIARKDSVQGKGALFERFTADLDHSRKWAMGHLPEIAASAGLELSKELLIDYWRHINYGLDERALEGMRLFKQHLIEMELL